MSYLLPHLHSGWAVDQAILAEEERLVIIRFGHDWDETCMQMSDAKRVRHANGNSDFQNNSKGEGSSTPPPATLDTEKLKKAPCQGGEIEAKPSLKATQEVSTVEHAGPGAVTATTNKRKFTPQTQGHAEQLGKRCKFLRRPRHRYFLRSMARCDCCNLPDLPCSQVTQSQGNGEQPPRSLIPEGNSSPHHMATPAEAGKGPCFNCGEIGHFARHCQNATSAEAEKGSCFTCGEIGHFARECHKRKGATKKLKGAAKKLKGAARPHAGKIGQKLSMNWLYLPGIAQCTICGNQDHREEDCYRMNTQCFRCEQYGHYAYKCPTKHWSPQELQCYIFDKRHEDEALSIRMRRCSLA